MKYEYHADFFRFFTSNVNKFFPLCSVVITAVFINALYQQNMFGRGLVDHKLVQAPPVILLLAVPRRLLCFGSLVVLDVVFRYLSLCLLYINTKIGKKRCLMLD